MKRRHSTIEQTAAVAQPVAAPNAPMWKSSTLWLALAGSLLLWLSFPRFDLWPLAWIAPLPWLWLVQKPVLSGRRPYVAIWLAGLVHWLIMLQGLRLAHPALYAGWFALSWYLAFYLPAFVGLTRLAVHRLGVSIVVAAPIVWVGLELIRGYLLTGFSLALLAHTQVRWTMVLQVSDLVGAYAVSFVMMLVAASIARVFPLRFKRFDVATRPAWWPAVAAAGVMAATLGYGVYRLNETPPAAGRPPVRVALIQGSLDTIFDIDERHVTQTFDHYRGLTAQAVRENPPLDLVVWPESMFRVAEYQIEEPLAPLPEVDLSPDEWRKRLLAANEQFMYVLAEETNWLNSKPSPGRQAPGSAAPEDPTPQESPAKTHLLIGTTTFVYSSPKQKVYNAAILADPNGKVANRYYKMHPVMFGEYIPLGEVLPWIYGLTPMSGGLSRGDGPKLFDVAGLKMSPSICFESVVPHLIRRHVVTLNQKGTSPDALVNITNDGWFWGTAILDLHLRCAVFRAVENRKPMLVAANTGFSAWIDSSGAIRAQGPRRQPAVLIAEVIPDGRSSPYHRWGDLPAWLCAAACVVFATSPWWRARNTV